jgi:hypothetical protein
MVAEALSLDQQTAKELLIKHGSVRKAVDAYQKN